MNRVVIVFGVLPRLLASLSVLLLALWLQSAQAITVPGLPSKPATATAAASEASAVAFAASLDNVINTLEDNQRRDALVAQLKKMRTVASAVAEQAKAEQNNGLLGSVNGLTKWLTEQTDELLTNQVAWVQLVRNAHYEMVQHIEQTPGGIWRVLFGFTGALAIWAAAAWILNRLLTRVLARFNVQSQGLPADSSTLTLLAYAARMIGPWALAFVLTVLFTRDWSHSVGGALAFLLAWCSLCGVVFAAMALVLFSLCGAGHRKVAVRVLLRKSMPWLATFGAMAALNDAGNDVRTQLALGMNVCFFITTVSHLINAALLAIFAVRFRRPIAQLIRNNAWNVRQNRKAVNETLQLVSIIWQWPIITIAVVAGLGILASAGRNGQLTDQAVRTVMWLVLAIFISLMLRRSYHARTRHPSSIERGSVYVRRLLQMVFAFANLVVGLVFLELILHTWHYSTDDLAKIVVAGRRLDQVFFSIATTLCVSWLVWVVLDAIIEERITGRKSQRRGERVSNRARTVLPLFRSVLLVVILIVAVILSLANLGINVNPLLAGAGVIGLAVGFGAQALVQDLITGIFMLVEDTIALGDVIDAGGHVGTVEGITMRTVRIRDIQGAVHTVPFSQIKAVKNLGRDFAYAVFDISVAYDSDLDKVLQIMRDTGREMSHDVAWRNVLLAPLEVQGLERFDTSAIVVRARFRTRPLEQWDVARTFNLRLKKNFDKAGVTMPFPQMDVHLNGSLQQPEALPAPPKDGAATA
ncbi:mechanosensitive ion channel domain-containing protein [Silvimonas sp.]|uniref:mechanosensitive ion channel family protein n=1 Tax=Silvimonas sp. TaxID=2650811 RepID=UPI002849F630|nr:mechanosensitive ion channel domain-containing protein [Silvimonas sp.]MDR3428892.1 mechanosensitive ion channel [Silvimonas sp.]